MTAPGSIPNSDIDSNQKQLGALLGYFPLQNRGLKRWFPLILGGLLFLASTGLIIVLVINACERITLHGRAIILSVFPYPAILYGGMFMAGLLAVSLALIFWDDGLTLYESGLVLCKARREHLWVFKAINRFDSHITKVTFGGSPVNVRVAIILEEKAKRRLVINSHNANSLALTESLRDLILPELIIKSRQSLLMGNRLFFHRHLQANQHEIIIHGRPLPINSIAYRQKNQVITLYAKDKPEEIYLKLKCYQVRNLDVLIDLLNNPPKECDHSSPK